MDSVDFDAFEDRARAKMAPASFAFCAAGADDEISAVENISAWRNLRLQPRVLNDVSNVNTRTSLLGHEVATPIMIAPTGRHKLFHAEGERATARGNPRESRTDSKRLRPRHCRNWVVREVDGAKVLDSRGLFVYRWLLVEGKGGRTALGWTTEEPWTASSTALAEARS